MPTNAEVFDLAWQHHQTGNFAEAERLYRQIIGSDPRHADAWCFLGAACQSLGKLAEAESNFRRAVHLLPDHPSAPNCLGIVLAQQSKLDEAARIFEGLLRTQPADPEVQNNLGLVRYKQGRLDEALGHYHKSLKLRPTFADAHNNLANLLTDQGDLDQGLAHYDEAIRLKPNFADAYFNRATPRILRGDFAGGWSDYEWRWRQGGYTLPSFRQPRWDGSALNGRTILLWAEQGLGDTLQFIRYAPLVKERGGRVIVASQAPLLRLLETCPGIDRLIAKDASPMPPFDIYVPMMSLPHSFGTTLATIPTNIPYLSADAELVAYWRREIGVRGQRSGVSGQGSAGRAEPSTTPDPWPLTPTPGPCPLRVGIAWQGNPTYRKDRQRSVPLQCFEPLLRVSGVQLISLQKGPGSEQLAAVGKDWAISDFSTHLDEASGAFRDTAAIMRNLDLVIATDSAIAHLAGALGVNVWVALPRMPDFRWMMDREDCPWYPTMRLFRQTKNGRWDDVFERIAAELRKLEHRQTANE